MSVGFPTDKVTIDARAGQIAQSIRNILKDDVVNFKTWLDSVSDASLITAGYTQSEVDLLRASFTDLDNLRKVATAVQSTGVNDFFFNSKKLTGAL